MLTHRRDQCRRTRDAADGFRWDRRSGTAVYLPPYSPDLNPSEQLFSKLKALLRRAAERTIPGLLRKIRSLLRAVSPDECLNFLRHAGYASK
jgi:transposase